MRAPALIAVLVLTTLAGCIDGPDVTPPPGDADEDDLWLGLAAPTGALRSVPFASFEPTLGIDSAGTLFLSTMDPQLGAERSAIIRSTDQGLTWSDITPKVAGVSFPPSTNDPYVYVDPDTDRVFNFDMHMLACMTLSWSDDGGDSWINNPAGCTPVGGAQDHQTLWASKPTTLVPVGYDNILHYCVNRVTDAACAISIDGGISWTPMRPLVYDGIHEEDLTGIRDDEVPWPVSGICSALTAHGTSAPDGTIYLPRGDCGGFPTVAISEDDGLTWTNVRISESRLTYGADDLVPHHEVQFRVDEAGNAYAFWLGEERQPWLAISDDGGWNWGEPILMLPENVTVTDFPVLAAGGPGMAAVGFIGTESDAAYGEMPDDAEWHGYISVIVNATTTPDIRHVQVNDEADPVARGVCGGTRCMAAGAGFGDFLDLQIDPDGRPWFALVDVCHDACDTGEDSTHTGTESILGTLASGPKLRGEWGALPELVMGPTVVIEETTG